MKLAFILPIVWLSLLSASAQTSISDKKALEAKRSEEAMKIDGVLKEAIWQEAKAAEHFTQFQFKWDVPSAYRSDVRFVYSNDALYVGATLYDPSPDSIRTQITQRDDLGASDFFGFMLDTYRDGINGFEFFVTASGVQLEAKVINGGMEDFNWDAVWQSAVKITEQGWVAEIKIPYSAIRFPNQEKQEWGLQIFREVNRNRDKSAWNRINPEIQSFVAQAGVLTGIEGIEAPVRLSLTPYFSAYYDRFNDQPQNTLTQSTSYNGGADLKYGLNDAFTLDMTLIPDFGQVQSDNQILNLTPFEVYFVERRQFFTEGVELFDKGGLFYSRRIGGIPIGFNDAFDQAGIGESVISNPQQARLLNATKVSGRTQGGLGVGVFNAIEGETFAVLEDSTGVQRSVLTGPFSNYSVVVFDQNLKNNSNFYIINTNVLRNGSYQDANVTASGISLRNAENIWGIDGGAKVSERFTGAEGGPEMGYAHNLRAGKVGGNFQATAGYWFEGPGYNPNDLGFLQINNTVNYSINLQYGHFKPWWKFNTIQFSGGTNYTRIVEPDAFFNYAAYLDAFGGFKNFLFAGVFFYSEPVITYDWFEPRTPGRYYTFPVNHNTGGWVSTDYSKKLAFDGNVNYRWFGEEPERDIEGDRFRFNIFAAPRFRFNDKLFLVAEQTASIWNNDIGFAGFTEDSILLGRRDVREFSSIINFNYTPTVKMGVSFRLRHYWSFAQYRDFYNLSDEGLLDPSSYDSFNEDGSTDNDVNFNAFNIDLVYTWFFAPGSELNLVWKNAIYQFGSEVYQDYLVNMENVFDSPINNNFSIKVIYFLDYLYLRKS